MEHGRTSGTVLCYVEGNGSAWEGVCVDLDIAIQGVSADEVVEGLRAAIAEYLAWVAGRPEEERGRLYARRVPLHVRVVFAALAFWSMVRRKGYHGPRGRRERFTLPCAA